jgi:hypothetical protein
MGCCQAIQPVCRKEGIPPALMIRTPATTSPATSSSEDAAQPHPNPAVQCRERRFVAVFDADFHARKLGDNLTIVKYLVVFEYAIAISNPGNAKALLVQGGFPQDRVVRPFVEPYADEVMLDSDLSGCFHKLSVNFLGF